MKRDGLVEPLDQKSPGLDGPGVARARSSPDEAVGAARTAAIAEDLRSMLSSLNSHLGLVNDSLKQREIVDAAASATAMEKILERALESVNALFAAGDNEAASRAEWVDLNASVVEACRTARARLPRSGARVVSFASRLGEPSPIRGRPAEIVCALINLLVNAIEAMPSGGIIAVRTGTSDRGTFVQIEDEGTGVPDALRTRIFEPFFTTKDRAGTGLGLSMVYATMAGHGGSVEVISTKGHGATFMLVFPHC
jgi:signal transduction histidine kinase